MKKSVVVVGLDTKSWAIGLEVALSLKMRNQEVVIIDISKFKGRRPRSINRILFERKFIKKHKILLFKLKPKLNFFYNPSDIIKLPKSIEILKGLTVEGVIVGNIIHAHFSALFGTDNFQIEAISKSDFEKITLKITHFLRSMNEFQKNKAFDIDSLYVFNGRTILEGLCVQIAKDSGSRTLIFERASRSNKFEVYSKSPHTNQEWWNKIRSFLHQVDSGGIDIDWRAVDLYMNSRSVGFDPWQKIKWRSYMDSGLMDYNIVGPYIAFFSVSTGEVSPFKEYESQGGYRTQFEALKDLVEESTRLNFKIVIRRHPNSLGIDKVDRESDLWKEFMFHENVIYIGPTSRVDSYQVAKNAFACFTWRSTIGFDTLVLGIPSYALGPAKWAFDDSVRAWSKDKLIEVLKQPEMPNLKIVEGFGIYMTHFGNECLIFNNIERWGVVTKTNRKIYNLLFFRIISVIESLI